MNKESRIDNPHLLYIKYRTTKEQAKACFELWKRSPHALTESYISFRRKFKKSWETLMGPFCGMIVGIEPDGYTHS